MKTTPEKVYVDSSVSISRMTGSGMPQSNSESKKRRKERGTPTALEIDQSLQSPVKSCLKMEQEMEQSCVEVSCSQVKIEGKEQNERRSGSDISGMDCDLQEAGTNVKHFEKDENTVPEVSEMNSTDVKHKSLILGEHIGFLESANTGLTEKCDDDLESKYVSFEQKNLKTYTMGKRGRTDSKGSGECSTSFQNSLESIKDDTRDPLYHFSGEVPTAGLQKKLDRALSGEHATLTQVMEDKLIEEASFNFMDSEPASKDCKERSKMKNLENNFCEISFVDDASVPDVPKEHLEQKNGGKHHMIQITGGDMSHINEDLDEPASYGEGITFNNLSGCDPSCKHLEQLDVERETKMEGSASHFGVAKDDAYSDIVIKEHIFSYILNSPTERSLMDSSKKKLLILDVNGILADIVPYVSNGYNADIMISGKAVFKRPFCDDFLQFCFDRFFVGVWSSRTKRNVDRVIDFLMGDSRHKLLFCWDQSHCTSTGFTTVENKEKPLVLKELRKLWQKFEPCLPWEKGEYNEANTLLLDDSPYKALLNPVNTAIFPHTYRYWNVEDMSLGPRGDLRIYMEGLAMAENVQKYVEENPFGQRPITESNLSWGFYRKVIETIAHRPQDDADTNNAHPPQDDANATTDFQKGEKRQGTVDCHQPLSVDGFPSQSLSDADAPKSQVNTSQDALSSMKNSLSQQSQCNLSIPPQNADRPSQLIYDYSISDSSPGRTSMTLLNKFSTSEPFPNMKSSTKPWPDTSSISQPLSSERFSLPLAPKESSHSISATGFSHHPSELHLPPVSQGVNAAHMPQLLKHDNLTPQSASFPFESAPGGSFRPNQVPLPKQHSQYSVPLNSSWTSLPPPPPRPLYDSTSDAGTATPGVSSQFQESHALPFSSQTSVRIYPSDRTAYTQVVEFPLQAYPSGQERHRPLSYVEDLGSNPLPKTNQPSQPFGGTSLTRESLFSKLPVQDLISSSSFATGNMLPSSRELFKDEMHPFSGELVKSSSQSHPHSQSQQQPYGLQYLATDSILGVLGKTGSVSRYPPDLLDGHQSSQLPDFGGSRISAHYNPYACTFEQPLSSKFSSGVFKQEKDVPYSVKFDSSFKLSHVPVDGLGVGHIRSSQITSSPSSNKAVGQLLPRSGGDQYDPFFDSIEPSSNSVRRNDPGQKPELTGESDTILRLSGTCKPLDVEEKHKEVGVAASTTSLDNEYGERADAEVGAVENESPSNPINVANMTGGDIEIDQVKSSGKSEKSKDSRSMKLFKIAVADFVKEVLKPSWRQGNMGKEAFKTIVKKTVDKVSGAMKSHQVPKSQAKIDRYIDSSQRKLTKLVMGYVDKYVKV